jgi:hypothetical protein
MTLFADVTERRVGIAALYSMLSCRDKDPTTASALTLRTAVLGDPLTFRAAGTALDQVAAHSVAIYITHRLGCNGFPRPWRVSIIYQTYVN